MNSYQVCFVAFVGFPNKTGGLVVSSAYMPRWELMIFRVFIDEDQNLYSRE